MERILQYLDDLDDLFGICGLLAERVRAIIIYLAQFTASLALGAGGVFVALSKPPLGLAVVILLFVTLLYRSVTAPTRVRLAAARTEDAAPIQP